MKKLVLLLLILVIVGGSVFAFDIMSYPPPLGNGGAVMIDMGLGYRNTYGWLWSLVTGYKMAVPPIFMDAAFALPNIPISVGLSTAYWQYKYSYYYSDYGWRDHFLFVGTKADWHFGFPMEMLDVYAGITAGWRFNWYNGYYGYYSGSYTYRSGFDYGAHAGIHFYFTPVFGAMAEVGYPFVGKIGLSLKFGGGGGSSGGKYVVNVDSLNVRSGPSADTSLVGALTRGTRVQVLDKSGTWWKIKAGNIEGYVNSSYLKED
jgi:uncharacterized protein YgiM (DUF1202 family)